ncbi:MAG: pyruvate kinase [Rhodospirillaceae bacterium TMED8]|nr:pyruvate kinase [Magnetovibrio sp.]OUT50164.1 MAG: pyruvate kinase [Rhodospirillaceae bacterium TMED8]
MRRYRNSKIIATLGPATSGKDEISALFKNGVDVFRLNFSHGRHKDHQSSIDIIRGLEREHGRPIGVMLDLQGPKIRVGKFKGYQASLEQGDTFRFDLLQLPGDSERVELPHPEIFAALKPGMNLLVNDGRIRLEVKKCGLDFAETEVVTAGVISDHKGVNVPDAVLDLSPLTEKDQEDLQFGLQLGIDWVALSFVQRPEDIIEAQKLIDGRAAVMAKLEKPMVLERLEDIIDLSDAIMVARGDLGVEMPPEDVPSIQKRMVNACREAGKPVVIATQMLESMIESPSPTRAEASDVATAVYEGADAVMLSAETAVGAYPTAAVAMMNRIIQRVEQDPLYRQQLEANRRPPEATAADAITAAVRQVAETISAAAIVTFTSTGSTTFRASRERPMVPIIGLTPRLDTARRLALAWGVHSVHTTDVQNFGDMVSLSINAARAEEFAELGDAMAITAGVPFGTPGATNVLRIAWVE